MVLAIGAGFRFWTLSLLPSSHSTLMISSRLLHSPHCIHTIHSMAPLCSTVATRCGPLYPHYATLCPMMPHNTPPGSYVGKHSLRRSGYLHGSWLCFTC